MQTSPTNSVAPLRPPRRILLPSAPTLVRWMLLAGVIVVGCGKDPTAMRPPNAPVPQSAAATGAAVPAPAATTTIKFTEITDASGVRFIHDTGVAAGRFTILETLGGGIAVRDFDQDGGIDLLVAGGGTFPGGNAVHLAPPAYFRGTPGGYWDDCSLTSRAAARAYQHGVIAGDFNEDGFADALLTGYVGLTLLLNCGDGTFVEETVNAGLHDPLWSTGAGWGDINGDGTLDLYVAHYVDWSFENDPLCQSPRGGERDVCSPRRFNPLPDALYLSNGNGTFQDASRDCGLRLDGKGLGVLLADLDDDRDVDAYVTNDTTENFLYRNRGDGVFDEVGIESGTALDDLGTPNGSMGVDMGDFNADTEVDLFVANFEQESFAVYLATGGGLFRHSSRALGVKAIGDLFVGWAVVSMDAENDADEDVFVSTGHVLHRPTNAPEQQLPLLFENQGNGFGNAAPFLRGYFRLVHRGRGAACGDWDDDGDLDLAVVHADEPMALLRNDSPPDGAWLELRLIGTRSARDGVGTQVRVRAGDHTVIRQIRGGGSYLSTSEARLHFGLGADRATIDTVEVRWVSGATAVLDGLRPRRQYIVREPNIVIPIPGARRTEANES